jgi:hypothetical protein
MPRLLHIITTREEPLPEKIITAQKENPANEVEVFDLTQGEPDYQELVGKIFAADSVAVW